MTAGLARTFNALQEQSTGDQARVQTEATEPRPRDRAGRNLPFPEPETSQTTSVH